ncbi:TPA: hypothetical protein N0F65_006668 [Lagenidium giganteum]|uniref:tRNA ligase phosphodiesterase domain-containing protein n=1 Tax=Lagenidium giganteum TaxID=4803 RepID=A0AAV2Z7R9_9STRA|nr:TPA: hypothetical protein N0F65_006668 [Lagenidium giganteum]
MATSTEDHEQRGAKKGDARQRSRRQQRNAQAHEEARLRQSAVQLTVVAEFATGGRLALLVFGLDRSEQLIHVQRVLAGTIRSSDMAAPLVCHARHVDVRNGSTTSLRGWGLTADALDAAWRVAQALLLRLQSLGTCGKVLLDSTSQCIAGVAAPTIAQVDAWDEIGLEWQQLLVLTDYDPADELTSAKMTMPLQRVALLEAPRTDLPLFARMRNPRLLSWAQDHLFKHVDATTGQPAKAVVILRGIPGSGKSSLARDLTAIGEAQHVGCVTCSADLTFETQRGYMFDAAKIGDAHATCQAQFLQALHDPAVRVVIVDNTHTQLWEYEQYETMTREQGEPGTRVHLLEMRCRDVIVCAQMAARNSHGVPVAKVLQMYHRWTRDDRAHVFEPSFEHALVNRNPISRNEHARVAYVGLFVEPDDRATLLQQFPPAHSVVFGEHVTLCYRPTAQYVRHAPVGQRYSVDVDALFQDGQGQTLRVALDKRLPLRARNKVPHITVSVAENVGAYYSNELLEKDDSACQPVVPQVAVPARLGAVLVSNNRRVLSARAPYPDYTCPVASFSAEALVPPRQEISVVVVSEQQIRDFQDSKLAWSHALLVSHQLTHFVGSACPHTTRVLCVVTEDTPSSETSVVANALAFLDRQLLIPSHQLRFHRATVVSTATKLLTVIEADVKQGWKTHVKVLDMTDGGHNVFQQSLDATAVASLSVHHLGHRGMDHVQLPPCGDVLDVMDVFGLGVTEESRFLIEKSMQAANDALKSLDFGGKAVLHRTDSCILGVDADIVELTALLPAAVVGISDMLAQLQTALREQGVHHAELTESSIFYCVCTKATYSPLIQLRVAPAVDGADTIARVHACVALQSRIQSLNGGFHELFVSCAVLLRTALRAHGKGRRRWDAGLWAEQAVWEFFQHKEWVKYVPSTSDDSDEGDRVGSANVMQAFRDLVAFLEGWDEADWATLAAVDASPVDVQDMGILGVISEVCQVFDAGRRRNQESRDDGLLRWVYDLTKERHDDQQVHTARSCMLLRQEDKGAEDRIRERLRWER